MPSILAAEDLADIRDSLFMNQRGSPLTAKAACLETFKSRWAGAGARAADRDLVVMALRKPRIAARLVPLLGDSAQLDELAFKLRSEVLDAGEVLSNTASRFGQRVADQGASCRRSNCYRPHYSPLSRRLRR